ncbi:HNH endonuclease signature motif containing protein [Aspergillus puulaauensis]|uniref:HNH nuclease domain-containing protein n=1 Tax=Aspergillus puulaauensis TaxID=1220207 RepID=A0A7R8AMM3_9EURO|nr:uncharacterized protein APUU_40411A [Aspergillus puulaauensis]BCS23967.1 hypothetical protein APUU_40411A [Aspergillus puulaauensis]
MSYPGSLSLAASSDAFQTFAQAKYTLDRKLADYQPSGHEDDTAEFLRIFFKYLPLDGQVNLAEDVDRCPDSEILRQLAKSLDDGLLRPMLAHGGITPAITPSPRFGIDDSIDNLVSEDASSITRAAQSRLRKNCLARDGQRCVVSNIWNKSYKERPTGSIDAPLEAVHIIPFALDKLQEDNDDERFRHAAIWVNIYRYFPSLRSQTNFFSEDINKEMNVMMMWSPLHQEFGEFYFVFEATETLHRYRIKTFPRLSSVLLRHLPPDRLVTFTNHDERYSLPDPIILQIHSAIGNILHLTGRGEKIELLKRDLRDADGLASNGSTPIGDLLSVSSLSLLLCSANNQPDSKKPKKKQPHVPGMMFSTGNKRSRGFSLSLISRKPGSMASKDKELTRSTKR